MATKTIQVVVDDLTGEELRPGKHQTINFAVNGKEYSIDLGKKNAEEFLALLARYTDVATAVRQTRGKSRKANTDLNTIRAWARENGHTVADRGRVSQAIVDAYLAAH